MPLTLTLTEGVIPAGSEQVAVAQLSDALESDHFPLTSMPNRRVEVVKKNNS